MAQSPAALARAPVAASLPQTSPSQAPAAATSQPQAGISSPHAPPPATIPLAAPDGVTVAAAGGATSHRADAAKMSGAGTATVQTSSNVNVANAVVPPAASPSGTAETSSSPGTRAEVRASSWGFFGSMIIAILVVASVVAAAYFYFRKYTTFRTVGGATATASGSRRARPVGDGDGVATDTSQASDSRRMSGYSSRRASRSAGASPQADAGSKNGAAAGQAESKAPLMAAARQHTSVTHLGIGQEVARKPGDDGDRPQISNPQDDPRT